MKFSWRHFIIGKIQILLILSFISYGLSAQPVISTFSPDSGNIGSLVTIHGIDFNQTDSIFIGGVKALILSSTDTKIVGMVMPGVKNGDIKIYSINGIGISTTSFRLVQNRYPSQFKGIMPNPPFYANSLIGASVALSNDGKTALIGAPDYQLKGATNVCVKNETAWTIQGSNLLGSGSNGRQGYSVALSADGNTAMTSCMNDSIQAWFFIRNGTTWTQQAAFLNLTGLSGNYLYPSVALSADGNIAALAVYNNEGSGGLYILKRSGNFWSQYGTIITVTDTNGFAKFGYSIDISAEGKTVLVGGPSDNGLSGAIWLFIDSSGTYKQQGPKLIASNSIGKCQLGVSVALSADGNTAIAGGSFDGNILGAIWEFNRLNGVWNKGTKITYSGSKYLGRSVSLSADGTIIFASGAVVEDAASLYSFKKDSLGWYPPCPPITPPILKNYNGFRAGIALSADGSVGIAGEPGQFYSSGMVNIFESTPIQQVGISEESGHTFKIYPNPTSSHIHIDLFESEISSIAIYNYLGQQFEIKKEESNLSSINVSHLPNGIYFIAIESNYGIQRFKFLKQ